MTAAIRNGKNRHLIVIALSLVMVVLAQHRPAPSLHAQSTPLFEPQECMFTPVIPGQIDADTRCGYVTVPEQRSAESADNGTIRLAVVVLGSQADNPSDDPLFIAQGGPGGSTIETYSAQLFSHPLRATRDIVPLRSTRYIVFRTESDL